MEGKRRRGRRRYRRNEGEQTHRAKSTICFTHRCVQLYLVSVRKGSFSALGRWDRQPTWPLPSAVAAEASAGSITDLDAPRGGTHVRLRASP